MWADFRHYTEVIKLYYVYGLGRRVSTLYRSFIIKLMCDSLTTTRILGGTYVQIRLTCARIVVPTRSYLPFTLGTVTMVVCSSVNALCLIKLYNHILLMYKVRMSPKKK